MHRHLNVTASLKERNQFDMRFTPAFGSSTNLMGRLLADLTDDCLRDGRSARVREFKASIMSCSNGPNQAPMPCRWNASGAETLTQVQRARQALERGGNQSPPFLIQDIRDSLAC